MLMWISLIAACVSAGSDDFSCPEVTISSDSRSSLLGYTQVGSGTFSFASGSLASYCSVTGAADSDTAMSGIHCFKNINDGIYGNSHSWIGNGAGAFAGFRLDDSNSLFNIQGFCVSRDNTGVFADGRATDTLTFQVTTDDFADANSNWCEVGSISRVANHLEICFTFSAPVEATAIRIITDNSLTCIDELQVFGEEVYRNISGS